MIKQHDQVCDHTLICGPEKEQFGYGKMFPHGKRVPAGDQPGDTFTYYLGTKIEKDNLASIYIIFDQALVCLKIEDGTLLNNLQDAIMMLTTVKQLCSSVVNDIVSQTEISQLDTFGDLEGTMFYCEKYISL